MAETKGPANTLQTTDSNTPPTTSRKPIRRRNLARRESSTKFSRKGINVKKWVIEKFNEVKLSNEDTLILIVRKKDNIKKYPIFTKTFLSTQELEKNFTQDEGLRFILYILKGISTSIEKNDLTFVEGGLQ